MRAGQSGRMRPDYGGRMRPPGVGTANLGPLGILPRRMGRVGVIRLPTPPTR